MSDPQLYNVIVKNECRNTHHKLVMNSLARLECDQAETWKSIFVRYFDQFLRGSKDPDTKFRDFQNHVLHVSENYWGGPVKQAELWYAKLIENLEAKKWSEVAYSAGCLSHYYMDPIMPLHTGQTEEEGVIHRACEWSINKSFDSLIEQLEAGAGYPTVQLQTGSDWLKKMVHSGAEHAHNYYNTYIDHYNIDIGAKDPPAGLDDELRKVTGHLLGYASVGFARILERAFEESSAQPVQQKSGLISLLYKLTSPFSWFAKSRVHGKSRGQVTKIVKEFKSKGKVVKSLPRDDQEIRSRHADEILKVDIGELDERTIKVVGSKSTASSARLDARKKKKTKRTPKIKFRLDVTSALVKAPSIGPKTAKRFKSIGIVTVDDFLMADAGEMAEQLDADHIQTSDIEAWQVQAKLACQIPCIYGHDAQILAHCGFECPEEISKSEPAMILSLVDEFAQTKEAEFIIRKSKPDLEEVTQWIEWSKSHRVLGAA